MKFRHSRLVTLAALGCLIAVAWKGRYDPDAFYSTGIHDRCSILDGSKFTADTVRLSDFGQIVVNPATGVFTEAGYLPVLGFALNGQAISPSGFDDPSGDGWGAFVRYQATGTQAVTSSWIVATYSSLSYAVYGFNGLTTYGLDATGVAYESGGTDLTLLGATVV